VPPDGHRPRGTLSGEPNTKDVSSGGTQPLVTGPRPCNTLATSVALTGSADAGNAARRGVAPHAVGAGEDPQQPAFCRSAWALVRTCGGALGYLLANSLKEEQAASFWPKRCNDMASLSRLSGALALRP
jgi:hypothetical protein